MCPQGGAWEPEHAPSSALHGVTWAQHPQKTDAQDAGSGDKLAKSHLHPESPCTLALLHQLARGLRSVHGDCRKSKGRAATQSSAGIFTRTRRTRRTTGVCWCVSLENACHSCHQVLEGPGGLALVRTRRRCRVTHRPHN